MSKKTTGPVGHHDLIPLGPELDSLPHDTFERVVAIFSGGGFEEEDWHRLYHVLGFVLKKMHEHDPLIFAKGVRAAFAGVPDLSADQAVAELKAHEAELTSGKLVGAAGALPPWLLSLGKLALQFLLQLLG